MTSPKYPKLNLVTAAHYLRKYTWLECADYTDEIFAGAEPPLSILLAMFVYKGGPYRLGSLAGIKKVGGDKDWLDEGGDRFYYVRFFSEARVHRILQAVISREADQAVYEALQRELDVDPFPIKDTVARINAPLSDWLRRRILKCFDPDSLETLRQNREGGAFCHITVDELVTLPLRDPYCEIPCIKCDETIPPERRQLLLSLSAQEKINLITAGTVKGLALPPNVGAKVVKITDSEWTFVLKNLTVEETDIHHHAIWNANF